MKNLRKMFGGIAVVLCSLTAAVPVVQAAERPAKADERVVIQVSDGDPVTWNQALNVARNLRASYGPGTQIEVVVFGNGIGMLTMDSVVGNRVDDTVAAGVPFYACENSMRGRKLTKEDMLSKASYVPAGIVEIIDKQRAGWATVRP